MTIFNIIIIIIIIIIINTTSFLPAWPGVDSDLSVGPEGDIERGFPGRDGRYRRSAVTVPGEGSLAFSPARGRCHHPGIHQLRGLRVGNSLQVGSDGLLHSSAADHVEPRGGHLDGPAGGHGPHEAALS